MRTLDIIEYVVARGAPVVAQEIASALVIPVSSLSYLLATLVERGYLAREGRTYVPGPGLTRLQARAEPTIEDKVAPLVRALRVQLNETASFFVREGWELLTLVTETSDHALRYAIAVGSRAPLHSMAAGKAILAALPPAEVARYLAETTRARYTDTTMVEPDALLAELERIRKTGIARTRSEYSMGIEGVGCAVVMDGEVTGAFSVAIPSVRFDAGVERRVGALLGKTAALLDAE
ncbi:helix-turn-helix domain-containing protein [Novosphingobium sp. FSY-8]|uniref:Helix-turn-helix domain-containing protein n=2 Tax=Novosphingobium ovatum TaxID=1908523 RepID=A0ABW9XDW7_9SPHN|nr:helix-turn-helix domain-containing protein [Novosphingobium ovatum]